jgi:hypothetical protein
MFSPFLENTQGEILLPQSGIRMQLGGVFPQPVKPPLLDAAL